MANQRKRKLTIPVKSKKKKKKNIDINSMEESDDEYIPSSDEEVPRQGRKAWGKASIRSNKKNLTKEKFASPRAFPKAQHVCL